MTYPSVDFQQLAAKVELEDRISLLAAQVHALEAELIGCVSALVELGGASGDGFKSVAHWVSVRTKYTLRDAREIAAVAERADVIAPLLEDARSGQLSRGLLAPAARVAHPDNLDSLRETLAVCAPSQALKVLRTYRSVKATDHDVDDVPLPRDLWWHHWTDSQGRYRVDAALDPLTGALLDNAYRAARSHLDRDGERPSADAVVAHLADQATTAFEAGGHRSRGGDRFRIQIQCDLSTAAAIMGLDLDPELPVRFGSSAYLPSTGTHLRDADLGAALCDSPMQILVDHDGVPLWLGHERRLFSPAQRRALLHQAGGSCEFPGCTNTAFLDVHHLCEVARDGPTDLPNGAVICPSHHHDLHRHKWRVARQRDGTLLWADSEGRPLAVAKLPTVHLLPVPPAGFTPDTPSSGGAGEPMTAYALDILLHDLLSPASAVPA